MKNKYFSLFLIFIPYFTIGCCAPMGIPIGRLKKASESWSYVTAGKEHAASIKGDGTLWTWGSNEHGQLGNGTKDDEGAPIEIGTDSDWSMVLAGENYTLALKSNGTLWAWGDNKNWQLGDGTNEEKKIPMQVGNDTDWKTISAGKNHVLAIKTNYSLWAWGKNKNGQLGDGTKDDRNRPTQIGKDLSWKEISAGDSHSLAIKTDGSLWSWGSNAVGQLGDGTNETALTPKRIGLETEWISISAGSRHTMALKEAKTSGKRTLWACGENGSGQLGDGTNEGKNLLTKIEAAYDLKGNTTHTDTNWKEIKAGAGYNMATTVDGKILVWGSFINSLGINFANSQGYSLENIIDCLKNIEDLRGIDDVDSDKLSADDIRAIKQIGLRPLRVNKTPFMLGGIALGSNFSLGLTEYGSLWSLGINNRGQLGKGTVGNNKTPKQTGEDKSWKAEKTTPFKNIAVGEVHSVGIKDDGSLWTWGANWFGQIGDGGEENKQEPREIGNKWVSVAAGRWYTIGLKADNTLWAWGVNSSGQLGDGTNTNKGFPTEIGGNWAMIAAGQAHNLGIKTDGTLWAWGLNINGQLGDKTSVNKKSPTMIGSGWALAAAGEHHSLAIKTDGTLWAWGMNAWGQLGDGTTESKKQPIQIGIDNDWAKVNAGFGYSLAIKSDGTLWTWGLNDNGQIGDGTTENKKIPTKIGNNWKEIVSNSWSNNVGIKTDGTLWAWGLNDNGQIGDGTTENKKIPTKIGIDNNWIEAATSGKHTIAVKSNGSLWAWGLNINGQLGNGSAWSNMPTLVLANTSCNVKNTYYFDSDEDGYGENKNTVEACTQPDEYTNIPGDCENNESSIYPGAKEICGDGIDQDCSGKDFIICPNYPQISIGFSVMGNTEPLMILIRATDSDGIGSVTLFHRPIGSLEKYTQVNISVFDGKQWINEIPSDSEYYIQAKDKEGNISQSNQATTPGGRQVPIVSEWGVFLLVLLILLSRFRLETNTNLH